VGAQAVDGLGGEGDEPAGGDEAGRMLEISADGGGGIHGSDRRAAIASGKPKRQQDSCRFVRFTAASAVAAAGARWVRPGGNAPPPESAGQGVTERPRFPPPPSADGSARAPAGRVRTRDSSSGPAAGAARPE